MCSPAILLVHALSALVLPNADVPRGIPQGIPRGSLPGARATASDIVTVDRDNTVVRRSCTLVLPAAPIADADGNGVILIEPSADGGPITVDLVGGTLAGGAGAPETHAGIGIAVRGAGVTLRNGSVRGFKVGIHAEDCDGLVLEDLDTGGNYAQRLRSTPDAEAVGDWLYPHRNDDREWTAQHGAGISVRSARHATIRRITSHGTQNGIVLDRVADSAIHDNDCSFLSGWGIAMWRSSRNTVCRNRLIYCIRGYSHGVYNRGQDSAGLLMFEQCCDNLVALNSITHGGDGVFGFAGREALGEAPCPSSTIDFDDPLAWYRGRGCSGNIFARNDLSFAAAHGLEMTFSARNLVYRNTLEGNAICGIWGGYARDTVIARNDFRGNGGAGYGLERGGANLEHAQRVRLEDNRFSDEPVSVHLWTDADEGLRALPWTKANGAGAADNAILRNTFTRVATPIELRAARGTRLEGNSFDACERTVVEVDGAGAPAADSDAAASDTARAGPDLAALEQRLAALPGTTDPTTHRVGDRGRADIVMGPYAPWNHRDLLIVPAAAAHEGRHGAHEGRHGAHEGRHGADEAPRNPPDSASADRDGHRAAAHFRVLGLAAAPAPASPDAAFEVSDPRLEATPLGAHPDGGLVVAVRARTAGPTSAAPVGSFVPFTLRVRTTDPARSAEVDGTLVDMTWRTRVAVLDAPGEPPLGQVPTIAEVRRRTSAPDAVSLDLARLDLDRARGGPRQLAPDDGRLPQSPDRFCLSATTTIDLDPGASPGQPHGPWRLEVSSDDGVVVRLDGRTILERWDIHGPTTDTVEFSVDAPRTISLEIDYFQNSGASRLRVRLVPPGGA